MALSNTSKSPSNTEFAGAFTSLWLISKMAPDTPRNNPAAFVKVIFSFKSRAAIIVIRMGVIKVSSAP